ncbi:hypothetical protein BKA64DRAFT_194753 [Cadophora sp. MPI-SDFR-AT-0126]|nr:hypothetical protein BKA64DRAFT_194753 [Leotiomycetes sp. MPI-SDFR-AT-0126]
MASTQSAATAPTATFHKFQRLPLELRCMIWHFAARQVRVVEIEMVRAEYKGVGRINRFASKTLTPAILHACGESRWIGLKRYERIIFNGIMSGSYVNWDVDYIGFRPSKDWDTRFLLGQFLYCPGFESCEVIKHCSRLVTFEPIPHKDRQNHAIHYLRHFKNLEELIFLFPGDFGGLSQLGGNIKLAPMTTPNHTNNPRQMITRMRAGSPRSEKRYLDSRNSMSCGLLESPTDS